MTQFLRPSIRAMTATRPASSRARKGSSSSTPTRILTARRRACWPPLTSRPRDRLRKYPTRSHRAAADRGPAVRRRSGRRADRQRLRRRADDPDPRFRAGGRPGRLADAELRALRDTRRDPGRPLRRRALHAGLAAAASLAGAACRPDAVANPNSPTARVSRLRIWRRWPGRCRGR